MVNVKNPSSEDTSVKKYRFKNLAITLLPIAALVVLFGLFCIVVTVNDYNLELYLTNVINRGKESGDSPIYSKEVLDTIIGKDVTYQQVADLVESK